MTIDIVDLTQSKYSRLNAVQLALVRSAQAKKDKILEKAEQEKGKIFRKLIANGTVRSSMLASERERIDAETAKQVEIVRADLDYQLAYKSGQDGNDSGPYSYPMNPNYNLAPSQRLIAVRDYYMSVTNDPNVRLQAYAGDTLAKSYLGDYYGTLYDLFASYC